MKQFLCFSLILLFLNSCEAKKEKTDQVVLDRIEYVYQLKSIVEKDIWPDFNSQEFDVPLIYYTENNCYVANPTSLFLSQFESDLIFQGNRLEIYKTSRIDSIPFHMSVGMLLNDSSAYNFKTPYIYCSSVETTSNTIPDVPSTEVWATMVLHEYFHGFQFKLKAFRNYFVESNAIPQDSLKNIYTQNSWFREYIDKENELLLSAIAASDSVEVKQAVDSFFQIRDLRRKKTQKVLKVDIETAENLYETMEGTARYVENKVYRLFSEKQPDSKLLESDSLYQSYAYFQDSDSGKTDWFYKTGKSYFYATGLNIARLLDKLQVEYKSILFSEGKIPMEEFLKSV